MSVPDSTKRFVYLIQAREINKLRTKNGKQPFTLENLNYIPYLERYGGSYDAAYADYAAKATALFLSPNDINKINQMNQQQALVYIRQHISEAQQDEIQTYINSKYYTEYEVDFDEFVSDRKKIGLGI